jgi:hypothetical protein
VQKRQAAAEPKLRDSQAHLRLPVRDRLPDRREAPRRAEKTDQPDDFNLPFSNFASQSRGRNWSYAIFWPIPPRSRLSRRRASSSGIAATIALLPRPLHCADHSTASRGVRNGGKTSLCVSGGKISAATFACRLSHFSLNQSGRDSFSSGQE